MAEPILRTHNLSKSFFGKEVVSSVNFSIHAGEIIALLGENGAGKSTLKNMLVGLLPPSDGTIFFDGTEYAKVRVGELGIAAVHQELSLFPSLSVAENVCSISLPGKHGTVNWKQCHQEARTYLDMVSAQLDLDEPVGALGPGEQQLIEIAKALRQEPRVLILDEPTASLTAPERERLLEVMRSLKRRNIAMVFITHFIDEVFEVCDHVCVLRNGAQVGFSPIEEITKREIEEQMVGRAMSDLTLDIGKPKDEPVLRLRDFRSDRFTHINLTVKRGEILGIAGLIGAGRTELMESIFGLRRAEGELELFGKVKRKWTPAGMIDQGVILVPEERKTTGIFPTRSVKENISCAKMSLFTRRILPGIGFRGEKQAVQKVVADLRVVCPGVDALITSLSGGNQQKAIVGRWLATKPKLCIFDDPTRGVDIGAKEEISSLIATLSRQGVSVLLVSSDINELLQLSHRILVMRRGCFVAEFTDRSVFDACEIISIASSTTEKRA